MQRILKLRNILNFIPLFFHSGGMPMNQMQPQQMQQSQMGQQQQQMQNQMGVGPGGMNPNVMNQMGGGGGVGGGGQMGMNVGGPGMVPGQMGMNPMGGGQPGNNNIVVPGGPQGMNPGGGGPNPMNPGMVGVGPGGVNQQMQNSPAGANQMNMMGQMGMAVRKPQEMMMNSPGNMFSSTGVRSVTPNQFLRENPSPSVPSPANMGNPQMIPSPAMAQSPSPQMMNVNQRNMANVMAPSPGASLNTPGQPGNIPSPMNPQEEQLYKEKYRQLVKYIEPLKRMTAKMMHEKNSE